MKEECINNAIKYKLQFFLKLRPFVVQLKKEKIIFSILDDFIYIKLKILFIYALLS
jgi:hypothetical protein